MTERIPGIDEPRLILGGRAHAKLLAAEGVLALMRNDQGAALCFCSPAERLGVVMALEDLIRDARKTVAKLNDMCSDSGKT